MIEDIWRPLAVSPSRIHSKGNDDAIPRAMAVSLGEMDAPNLHLNRRPERWRILDYLRCGLPQRGTGLETKENPPA
jgi:hypothetical protein